MPPTGVAIPPMGVAIPPIGVLIPPPKGVPMPPIGVLIPPIGVEMPAIGVEIPARGVEIPAKGVEIPAIGVEMPANGVLMPWGVDAPAGVARPPTLYVLSDGNSWPRVPFVFCSSRTWKSCGCGVIVAEETPLTDCTPRLRVETDAGVSIPDVTDDTPEMLFTPPS